MNKGQFRACKWLLELLKKEKSKRIEDICKAWGKEKELSGGLDMLPRSFHRYKKTLREELGVEICCRAKDYAYYIKNPEILGDHNIPQWMLNTLSVDEKLRECISLMNRIRLEKIPSGGGKLDVVTYAMLRDKKLRFRYQRYGSQERKTMELGVCGLILYNQRWYILGEFDDTKKYTFALDRMWNPELTEEYYSPEPSFNVDAYFSEFYGIFNSGKDITNIVLRALDDEAYYMRDLPIHPSQKEIGAGDGYVDFMISVRPNNELVSYILSKKHRLKVLSPDSFVEEIKASAESICKLYQN